MKHFLKIHSREELDLAEALIEIGLEPLPDGAFFFSSGPTLIVIRPENAKTFDLATRFLGAIYFNSRYSIEYRMACMRLSQSLMTMLLKIDEQKDSQVRESSKRTDLNER